MSRKITKEVIEAFMNATQIRKANTSIVVDGSLVKMYLHGNLIAVRDSAKDRISITSAGWQTNTTKERLNGIPGVCISQRKWVWYLNGQQWDGKLKQI